MSQPSLSAFAGKFGRLLPKVTGIKVRKPGTTHRFGLQRLNDDISHRFEPTGNVNLDSLAKLMDGLRKVDIFRATISQRLFLFNFQVHALEHG